MSINQTIKVVDDRINDLDEERIVKEERTSEVDISEAPSIDQTAKTSDKGDLEAGSYEGTKHEPDISGPQQKSQETDDVYVDTRDQDSGLPPAGKNVGELNAFDLGRHD
ncbi:hypothetical protein [Psychrobacter sp.]|uniref:hypothetical protein n=1 Tax=Psychrobacter sp. TaxID=56811 RepID=UPI0025EE52B8|nr:hypothetical protein [Psychrobacter sp.]